VFIGRDFEVDCPSSTQVILYSSFVICASSQNYHFLAVSLKKVKLYFLVNLGVLTSKIFSEFIFYLFPSRETSHSSSESFFSNELKMKFGRRSTSVPLERFCIS
jgi:hypothetical protein